MFILVVALLLSNGMEINVYYANFATLEECDAFGSTHQIGVKAPIDVVKAVAGCATMDQIMKNRES